MKKTSVLLLLMAWAVSPVFAQETSSSAEIDAPEETTNDESVEKIPVVGSRIRQIDLEGASPVKVIDREEIEKSASHSVGGILQRSTLSPYGGSERRINVRGLGETRTLVLINGRRTPKTGEVTAAVPPISTLFPFPLWRGSKPSPMGHRRFTVQKPSPR